MTKFDDPGTAGPDKLTVATVSKAQEYPFMVDGMLTSKSVVQSLDELIAMEAACAT
jgi:hypothetical protein